MKPSKYTMLRLMREVAGLRTHAGWQSLTDLLEKTIIAQTANLAERSHEIDEQKLRYELGFLAGLRYFCKIANQCDRQANALQDEAKAFEKKATQDRKMREAFGASDVVEALTGSFPWTDEGLNGDPTP